MSEPSINSKGSKSKSSTPDALQHNADASRKPSRRASSASNHSGKLERSSKHKKSENIHTKKSSKPISPNRTNSKIRVGAEEVRNRISKEPFHIFSGTKQPTDSERDIHSSKHTSYKELTLTKPKSKDVNESTAKKIWNNLSPSLSTSQGSSHHFSSDSIPSLKSQHSAHSRSHSRASKSRKRDQTATKSLSRHKPSNDENALINAKSSKTQRSKNKNSTEHVSRKLLSSGMGSGAKISTDSSGSNSGCMLSSRIHGSIFHPLNGFAELHNVERILPVEHLRLEFDMIIPDKTIEYGAAKVRQLKVLSGPPINPGDNRLKNDSCSDFESCALSDKDDAAYDTISLYTANETLDGGFNTFVPSSNRHGSDYSGSGYSGVTTGNFLQPIVEVSSMKFSKPESSKVSSGKFIDYYTKELVAVKPGATPEEKEDFATIAKNLIEILPELKENRVDKYKFVMLCSMLFASLNISMKPDEKPRFVEKLPKAIQTNDLPNLTPVTEEKAVAEHRKAQAMSTSSSIDGYTPAENQYIGGSDLSPGSQRRGQYAPMGIKMDEKSLERASNLTQEDLFEDCVSEMITSKYSPVDDIQGKYHCSECASKQERIQSETLDRILPSVLQYIPYAMENVQSEELLNELINCTTRLLESRTKPTSDFYHTTNVNQDESSFS